MLHLRTRTLSTLATSAASAAFGLAVFAAVPALAHPGHDENTLGTEQWSSLRKGLHGAGDGITDDSIQADPPTTGRGLSGWSLQGNAGGGVGGLQGNGFGRYGAGSVGEPGPGGLGAMKTGGMGNPPRPR